MNSICLHNVICFMICMLTVYSVQGQENVDRKIGQSMEQNNSLLDRFSAKCERRTQKAEKRFARYERKMNKIASSKNLNDTVSDERSKFLNRKSLNKDFNTGLGREPLLDSLRLIHAFAAYTDTDHQKSTIKNQKSLSRAQQQLDVTQRTKSELLERKKYWKAQANEHPEYGKYLGKMEKERYYYTSQINEYRKTLRDPSNLDEKLMASLRRDPRWSEFAATLPAKPQNPEKMQPRQMIQKMMRTQAEAIDPDPVGLLSDAKKKGSELLGNLSEQATSFGNLDNAAQMPKFTPNPYKTKTFWQRIDIGFNLQFDNRTRFMPSTGVAGAQASFNFNPKLSVGALASYRFGMGEIKNIQFSHAGAGYGAFVNYKVWKAFGVQAGYERNWRTEIEMNEIRYPAAWTSSALAGLTWEYSVEKKGKASTGVFFDALYKRHTPESNAVLWRMGWKF